MVPTTLFALSDSQQQEGQGLRTLNILWPQRGALHPVCVAQSSALWVSQLSQSTWGLSDWSNLSLKDSCLPQAHGTFKKLHIWLN